MQVHKCAMPGGSLLLQEGKLIGFIASFVDFVKLKVDQYDLCAIWLLRPKGRNDHHGLAIS